MKKILAVMLCVTVILSCAFSVIQASAATPKTTTSYNQKTPLKEADDF